MRVLVLTLALATAGCASTYQLTLMPRDSGTTYSGTMTQGGQAEGSIAIAIEGRAYEGTWVQSSPDTTRGWVSGGIGRRGWRGFDLVTMDNPEGGESKALLRAADGSGLRCDLRNTYGRGAGTCRDDKGREYDVQIRPADKR